MRHPLALSFSIEHCARCAVRVYRFSLLSHSTAPLSLILLEFVRYMKIFNKCALYMSDTHQTCFSSTHTENLHFALRIGNVCEKHPNARTFTSPRATNLSIFTVISLIVVGFSCFSVFLHIPFLIEQFYFQFMCGYPYYPHMHTLAKLAHKPHVNFSNN